MSKLEDGYFYRSSGGDYHYVSYESAGGGLVFLIILVAGTVFTKKLGTFLVDNKWVVFIPAIIGTVFRTVVCDKGISVLKRIINIVVDFIKTACMFSVLIVVMDKVATAHWLDRVLFMLLYGGLFFVAYYFLTKAFVFLRSGRLFVAHLAVAVIVTYGSLFLYCNHEWYDSGYYYRSFFTHATLTGCDESIVGDVELPDKINNISVTAIGDRVFDNDISKDDVTSVVIPDGVTAIEEDAFSLCYNLKSVTIPKSVTKIESWAFSSSDALETVYYEGSADEWELIEIQEYSYIDEIKVIFKDQ